MTAVITAGAAPHNPLDWHSIDWAKAHRNVSRLQARIVQATKEDADIDPPHEALLLREHYTELLRTEEVKGRSAEFQKLLTQSEANAERLEDALRGDRRSIQYANRMFERVTADCTACHQKFRDVPLSEKAAIK